jgi:hypothetical protein
MNQDLPIFTEINRQNENYNNGYITLIDGLTFSQWQTLKKIEFYSNSQYLSGNKDELGRDKPFYNIVNYRVNVAVRATDIDVKDIKIISDNPNFAELAFLYDHEAYEWMKQSCFSLFLNQFGQTRARYGGVLVKKCQYKEVGEQEELEIEVVPWKNVITDAVDIENGVIVEKHYMLPNELAEKRDVWEKVEEAIKLVNKQERNLQGGNAKTQTNRVPIYEVTGVFPETFDPEIGEDGDETTFKLMRFIVAGEAGEQILLFKEDLDETPYKYLSWENVPGRGLGRGVVEEGFEAQRWTNDAVIGETNAMTLSGKVIMVTDSEDVGNNAITDLVNGSVVKVKRGESVQSLSLLPSSFPEFNNLKTSWDTQVQRSTNTFDAVTGETMPSGTPLGSLAIQAQQASSYFDYKREEAGVFITELFNDWVLPFLAKRINREHILSSEFSGDELAKLDESFATALVNEELKQKVLSGQIVTPEDYQAGIELTKQTLGKRGKRRFLEIPTSYFKNFEPKVSVIVTKELKDIDVEKKNLEYISMIIAKNPQAMQDPTLAKIIGRMAELSGILSPGDLSAMGKAPTQPANIPQQPTATAAMQNANAVMPEAQQA